MKKKKWNYQQDFSQLELYGEMLTLRMLSWEEYKEILETSYLTFLTIPETYHKRLLKNDADTDEDIDIDEDEDEIKTEDEDVDNSDDDSDNDESDISRRSVLLFPKAKKCVEDDNYYDDEWTRHREILNLHRIIKKFDTMDDGITHWFLEPVLGHEFDASLNAKGLKKMPKYSMRHFLNIRYIEKYKSHLQENELSLPESIEEFSDKYLSGKGALYENYQETYISYLCKNLETLTHALANSFEVDSKRHLRKIFNIIFGEGVFSNILAKKRSYEFYYFDCQFFSFLLNTQDDINTQNFLNQSFADIDPHYLSIIKGGTINLIRSHPELSYIDPYIIFAKWELTMSMQKLNNTVDRFIQYPKKHGLSAENLLEITEQVNRSIKIIKGKIHKNKFK